MSKAIVFYCKGCNEMIFAADKDPRVIRESKKEIIRNMVDGHRIEEVDHEVIARHFGECKCEGKQLELGEKS